MAQPKIIYYPVGNGDNSLIMLSNGTNILVDCNIRDCSKDKTIFDVKTDLIKRLSKRDNNLFVDVFILTHGDQDHCRGFKAHFYQGDPKNYSDSDRKENRIIVDEMWFSPMIAEEHTNNDEDAYQKEAERRINLHLKNNPDKDLPGNRIKIIGYDPKVKDYNELNYLRATPGQIVYEFNGKTPGTFSIFIHAPFKEQLDYPEDKNYTSIIFQARFKETTTSNSFSCFAMFGGDAVHASWKLVLERTKKYKNDIQEHALKWDLFLAPHHCSWTFFNDTPQDENPEPVASSLEILDYKQSGGKVIASSKKIVDNDDNPPHFKAKEQYVKKLASASDFINTSVEPSESNPQPLEFTITSNGPAKDPKSKVGGAIASAGGSGAASNIIKQG